MPHIREKECWGHGDLVIIWGLKPYKACFKEVFGHLVRAGGGGVSRLCDEATLANEAADNNNTTKREPGRSRK